MSHSPSDAESPPEQSYIDGWAAVYRLIRQGRSWSGRERNTCFLNTGDGEFVDASAVTGLDFPDDGRALAELLGEPEECSRRATRRVGRVVPIADQLLER